MSKRVRVNLFDVLKGEQTQRLSSTLDEFASLDIDRRARGDIRLEQVYRVPADPVVPYEVFHLEFAKERPIGPGRMSRRQPVTDVGLEEDELFGEETAALYLPRKRWLVVLNNHYGVGPSRMAGYFNALDPGNPDRYLDYLVQPVIDQRALDRMRQMQRFAEIEITASVGVFGELDDDVAESVSQAANSVRAQRLTLKLMANEKNKKGSSLTPRAVRHLINRLLPRSDDIDRLKIKGDDEALENKDKVIDLLKHKISDSHPASSLKVSAHRYTHGSKMDLLRRTCRGWLETLG